MHHEVDECKELLELAEFIGLFGGLMNVEPSLTHFGERSFDDLFKLAYPALLASVELNLCDA